MQSLDVVLLEAGRRNSTVSFRAGGIRHGPPAWILILVLCLLSHALGESTCPNALSFFYYSAGIRLVIFG